MPALPALPLQNDESVESDVCMVITAADQSTSLSSGQEVFCNHEYFLKGGPDDANHPHGKFSKFVFPNGFPFPPAFKLDVASVSQIFNRKLQSVPMDEVPWLCLDTG